jgi:hypothetical protein
MAIRPGRPCRRNTAASRLISLRSINLAKAADLPTGRQVRRLYYFFSSFLFVELITKMINLLMKIALRKSRNKR